MIIGRNRRVSFVASVLLDLYFVHCRLMLVSWFLNRPLGVLAATQREDEGEGRQSSLTQVSVLVLRRVLSGGIQTIHGQRTCFHLLTMVVELHTAMLIWGALAWLERRKCLGDPPLRHWYSLRPRRRTGSTRWLNSDSFFLRGCSSSISIIRGLSHSLLILRVPCSTILCGHPISGLRRRRHMNLFLRE